MKYLVMICRGHLPVIGVGKKAYQINQDVVPFIKYFLPKDKKLNQRTACQVVRHFHLAFKDMDERPDGAVDRDRYGSASSPPLTSATIWTLTAVAICACCAAVVSSWWSKRDARRQLRVWPGGWPVSRY
jgi:hypothetical protein